MSEIGCYSQYKGIDLASLDAILNFMFLVGGILGLL